MGRFTDILREEAKSIWDAILEHPFLMEMSEGSLPLDKFRFYVKQDYAYLIDFVRCLGIILDKVDEIDIMRDFVERLEINMRIELDMLEEFGEKIGLTREELRSRRMAPTNMAYTRYLLNVAHSGSAVETMAAMLPCIWSYGEIARKIGGEKGLREHPIFSEWCRTYNSSEYWELIEWYRDYVDQGVKEAGPAIMKKILNHFLFCSRYEFMFWDMAYSKECWPI